MKLMKYTKKKGKITLCFTSPEKDFFFVCEILTWDFFLKTAHYYCAEFPGKGFFFVKALEKDF